MSQPAFRVNDLLKIIEEQGPLSPNRPKEAV